MTIMDINELPKDPAILLSYINTKLRDDYPTLGALCRDLDIDRDWLERTLLQSGFEYSPQRNRFW